MASPADRVKSRCAPAPGVQRTPSPQLPDTVLGRGRMYFGPGNHLTPGLVWKPGIPPGTRPFPWAGSPRGNRPRAKSSRHLEAHGKGISDPIHQFSTGQPSRVPTFGGRASLPRRSHASRGKAAPPSASASATTRRRRPSASGRRPPLPSHRLLYLRRPSAARLPVGCNATTPSENSIYSSASSSSAGSTSYSSSAHVSPHPPS